jgi:hypothetical protein
MSKEQQELLNEVYAFYLNDLRIYHYPDTLIASKEEFINKCKTDTEFSEKWGFRIEERELSRDERIDLYCKEYTNGIRGKYEPPFDDFIDAKLATRNVPTRLITVTYNDKTIESYE